MTCNKKNNQDTNMKKIAKLTKISIIVHTPKQHSTLKKIVEFLQ